MARKNPLSISVPLWGEQWGLFNRVADLTGCPQHEAISASAVAFLALHDTPEKLREAVKAAHRLHCVAGKNAALPFKLP